jgi:hypothetical protein
MEFERGSFTKFKDTNHKASIASLFERHSNENMKVIQEQVSKYLNRNNYRKMFERKT